MQSGLLRKYQHQHATHLRHRLRVHLTCLGTAYREVVHRPIRDTLIEGFSHFVASMTAPIASGWSGCRVGLAPLESAALSRRTPEADIGRRNPIL